MQSTALLWDYCCYTMLTAELYQLEFKLCQTIQTLENNVHSYYKVNDFDRCIIEMLLMTTLA